MHKRFRAQWHGYLELTSNVNSRETRRSDAGDFKRMAVERDHPAHNIRAATVFPLPKRIADHRGRGAAAAAVILCGQGAAAQCADFHRREAGIEAQHPEAVAKVLRKGMQPAAEFHTITPPATTSAGSFSTGVQRGAPP